MKVTIDLDDDRQVSLLSLAYASQEGYDVVPRMRAALADILDAEFYRLGTDDERDIEVLFEKLETAIDSHLTDSEKRSTAVEIVVKAERLAAKNPLLRPYCRQLIDQVGIALMEFDPDRAKRERERSIDRRLSQLSPLLARVHASMDARQA